MADAEVGLSPGAKGNKLGAKLRMNQLEYYAHVPAVIDAAATAQGVPVTKKLQNDVLIGKAKPSKAAKAAAAKVGGREDEVSANILDVAVLQPTKDQAVGMTNAFVKSLGGYAQLQISSSAKSCGVRATRSTSPTFRTRSPLCAREADDADDDQAGHDSADSQAAQGQANGHSACPDDDEHDRKIRPGRTGPVPPSSRHSVSTTQLRRPTPPPRRLLAPWSPPRRFRVVAPGNASASRCDHDHRARRCRRRTKQSGPSSPTSSLTRSPGSSS